MTLAVAGLRVALLKSTAYEITPDRIEWSRGILNRRIDNLDMFRVVDIKLHRSLLDCVLGIGTVVVVSKDESDPRFEFNKVRYPRELYDILKKASLDADRRRSVIHVEIGHIARFITASANKKADGTIRRLLMLTQIRTLTWSLRRSSPAAP